MPLCMFVFVLYNRWKAISLKSKNGLICQSEESVVLYKSDEMSEGKRIKEKQNVKLHHTKEETTRNLKQLPVKYLI